MPELQQQRHKALSGTGNEDRYHLPEMPQAISTGQKALQVPAQRPDEIVLERCEELRGRTRTIAAETIPARKSRARIQN